MNKISACLVVYNEEKVIERCLKSIKDLVGEIIVVHDGECIDNTLNIVAKYTDKIFIKPHIGIAEPLRSFSYKQASGEWILQMDADEFLEKQDLNKIKLLLEVKNVDGYNFKWEMFDGNRAVTFPGLQKLCLFRKNKISNLGIPQIGVRVVGIVKQTIIYLRHRPLCNNISWAAANKKRKYWLQSHVSYFFPELVKYECFNTAPDEWVEYTKKVRRRPLFYMLFYPFKNCLGQLKNGLWKTRTGISFALQQFVYYFELYRRVWKMNKKLKLR